MDNNYSLLTIVAGNNALMERQAVDKILACNAESEKYGLILNEQQALALTRTQTNVLNETKRIEFNGGIVDKLISAFCDSPYISVDNFEDTLHELISLFYELKNNTWDRISDQALIAFMKNEFNNHCHGSLDMLSGEGFRLAEHIHCGKSLKTFQMEEQHNENT